MTHRSALSVDEVVVVRHGPARREYNLEHVFVRLRPAVGSEVLALVSSEARPMSCGKTSWHSFSACCDFMDTLRNQGCDGVVVAVYVTDRLLHSALKRHLRARHAMAYMPQFAAGAEGVDPFAELLDWNVYMPCRPHTIQSSIQWALKPWCDANTLKDAHNCVRSVRGNAHDLHSHLDEFLLQVVCFTEKTEDKEHVRCFWEFLDIPPRILDLFVSVDQIYDGTRLHVDKSMATHPNGWRRIKVCVLFCLRWLDWGDTRWLRCGRSSRYYLRSIIVGLDGLIALCLCVPRCNHL